ncbi:hypothetical protein N9L26_00090 [Candidatus Pacebacteria bacterium]|nr:hypothetical protein [Candidatus Paceibacterota bacterium]
MSTKIGFIGQGWIGKHYADDFENRGYDTVRYGLEAPYTENKDQIKDCDVVFIAVPTPTTPEGFDDSVVRSVLALVGTGKTAIIKSTIVPGTTESLQAAYPDIIVMHSPEFLREASAAHDAAHPDRNIVGISDERAHQEAAEFVMRILPYAPYTAIIPARDAEFVKYAGNGFLYMKVLFMNILYDLVEQNGGDYQKVREAMINDPRIGESHTMPVHASGHDDVGHKDSKRGAGGHCFIKDFEALRELFKNNEDDFGDAFLTASATYNNALLSKTNKDTDLLKGVYGSEYVSELKKKLT